SGKANIQSRISDSGVGLWKSSRTVRSSIAVAEAMKAVGWARVNAASGFKARWTPTTTSLEVTGSPEWKVAARKVMVTDVRSGANSHDSAPAGMGSYVPSGG